MNYFGLFWTFRGKFRPIFSEKKVITSSKMRIFSFQSAQTHQGTPRDAYKHIWRCFGNLFKFSVKKTFFETQKVFENIFQNRSGSIANDFSQAESAKKHVFVPF